jgi:predicted amino acid racemase
LGGEEGRGGESATCGREESRIEEVARFKSISWPIAGRLLREPTNMRVRVWIWEVVMAVPRTAEVLD